MGTACATLAFREHFCCPGLNIPKAVDTAQRGMGIDWRTAGELIGETGRAPKPFSKPISPAPPKAALS
jgi:hypothetical protein